MKKKFLVTVLVLVMASNILACGKDNGPSLEGKQQSESGQNNVSSVNETKENVTTDTPVADEKDGTKEHPYEFGDTIVLEGIKYSSKLVGKENYTFTLTVIFDEMYPEFDPQHFDDIAFYKYRFTLTGDENGTEVSTDGLLNINSHNAGGKSVSLVSVDAAHENRGFHSTVLGEENVFYDTGSYKGDESNLEYIYLSYYDEKGEPAKVYITCPEKK